MAELTEKLAKKAVEDHCPQCGSYHLDYQLTDWIDSENLYNEVYCRDCELTFKQWYVVRFDGQQVGEIDIPIENNPQIM